MLARHDDRAIEALIDLFPHNEHAWLPPRMGGVYAIRPLLDASWLPSHRSSALHALQEMLWKSDVFPELVDGLRHADAANSAARALAFVTRESLADYREQVVDALEEIIPAIGVKWNMIRLISLLGPDAFRLREVIRVRLEATGEKNCRRALDAIDGMPLFPG